uniref:Kelch-like protein diablo n=1 Tax=Glossina brevipalpis TaxID=37001 RepID=A0A1A9WVQ9_9MUSC
MSSSGNNKNICGSTDSEMYSKSGYSDSVLDALSKLRRDKTYCDFTLEVEGEYLYVHKFLLMVTSPYFSAMLENMYSCGELFKYCNEYILRRFPQLIDDEEFLQLSFDEFKAIITDDDLYVQSEENVYRGMLNWVKYDLEARRSHLPELMSHINLALVRPEFLQNHILTEPLFEGDLQCKNLIIEALCHYLPTKRRKLSSDTSQDLRRTQRRYGMPHILFAGGTDSKTGTLNTCRMYDTSNNILCDKSSMKEARSQLSAVSLNGLIYCMGGYNRTSTLKTAECYDPIINQWAQIAPMENDRWSHGVCVYNDSIYVVGGYHNSTVENYNPTTNKWYNCPKVPLSYDQSCRTVVIENSIYSIGDMKNERMSNNRFDPREGRWYDLNSNTNYVCRFELASYGRSLYCIGGWSGSFSNHCTRFDVCCNKWETMSPMTVGRWGHSALTVDNKIYVFGGWNGALVTTVERYDIPQNKWDTNVSENIEHISGATFCETFNQCNEDLTEKHHECEKLLFLVEKSFLKLAGFIRHSDDYCAISQLFELQYKIYFLVTSLVNWSSDDNT